jgi:hypothetical protein
LEDEPRINLLNPLKIRNQIDFIEKRKAKRKKMNREK